VTASDRTTLPIAEPARTPVVLLTFNRPALTRRVLEAVAQARPSRLYVVSDGPRPGNEGDTKSVAEVRALFDSLSWPCDVIRDFAPTNLGLRTRVSSGLAAAFARDERLIVLEDDCLPDRSFFAYCDALLERYVDDERVSSITGTNFQRGQRRTEASYYFSHRHHVWGWASWRRAWQHFDLAMSRWPEFVAAGGMASVTDDPYEESYWTNLYRLSYEGQMDSWAYPWSFNCLAERGLCIRPNANLVTNIGGADDPTHPNLSARLHDLPLETIHDLRHPGVVVRHREADMFEFDWAFQGAELRARFAPRPGWRSWAPRVKRLLRGRP
jgi:hypothetical protein